MIQPSQGDTTPLCTFVCSCSPFVTSTSAIHEAVESSDQQSFNFGTLKPKFFAYITYACCWKQPKPRVKKIDYTCTAHLQINRHLL